jgi:hypothetical protein
MSWSARVFALVLLLPVMLACSKAPPRATNLGGLGASGFGGYGYGVSGTGGVAAGASGNTSLAGTGGYDSSNAGFNGTSAGTGGLAAVGGSGGFGGTDGAAGTSGAGGTSGSGGVGGAGSGGSGGTNDLEMVRQVCVDTINMYRATKSLPPMMRATPSQEMCSDAGAKKDGDAMKAHSSAGDCPGFGAQDTCPGWGVGGFTGNATVADALKKCLAQMWAEGEPPVSRDACIKDYQNCFLKYGHYLNMTSDAAVVSCGFYQMTNGKWWMNQDFGG